MVLALLYCKKTKSEKHSDNLVKLEGPAAVTPAAIALPGLHGTVGRPFRKNTFQDLAMS
jgi:hypothetical protein